MKSKKRTLLAMALALGAGSLGTSPAGAASWDPKIYNPMPSDDDVILPMRCEGAMAFRKVFVPVGGPLDDYPVTVGQDSAEWGYIEQSRPVFIAGSFAEKGKTNSRYYLLAKYEITQLQYQVLTKPDCPEPSNKLRLPQTEISWQAAMAAADAYNLWLRKDAAKSLPVEDGVPGFVRLPTEVEWEFAARGGLEVGTAEFRDTRYPMPEGLNGYEWFAGAQSANGNLQRVGLLKPNPLGLHDMLGNADEMIFESFRLNKLDRQHGQAGGFIVRGGNYLTPQPDMRTASRREQSYYSATSAAASQAKTTGFRLALVAPTLTSRARVASIEKDWKSLGMGQSPEASGKADQGAVKQLSDLASGVQDKALSDKLKVLEGQLRASNQQQEEARDLAIRASLNLGAFLCTKLKDDGLYVEFLQKNYRMTCESGDADPSCDKRKKQLGDQQDRLHKLGRYYASSLVESSTLYGQALLERQVPVFEEIITRNKHLSELKAYLATHWKNQQSYLKTSKIDIEPWLATCKAVNNK
ncbi:MAG: formylglycine-generating enzyme family protein [Achromobacter sp.]